MEYKDIIDFPNYLIYKDGRVYSKKRQIFLKTLNQRYKSVILFNETGSKRLSIHRLLAIHYIDNPHDFHTVDHIDRDRYNNELSNLQWASSASQALNRNNMSTSKTCEKYIFKRYKRNSYQVKIIKEGTTIYRKCFPTLEKAISARNEFCNNINIKI
jgi:hypothetical protein